MEEVHSNFIIKIFFENINFTCVQDIIKEMGSKLNLWKETVLLVLGRKYGTFIKKLYVKNFHKKSNFPGSWDINNHYIPHWG